MEGWIRIYRKIFDNPYYFSERFCRSMAWIDLLLLANHKPVFFFKRGIKVDVGVGQVGYDVTTLAKRWKWSRNKCERWFRELEKDKQIERQKNNVSTLITICNYSLYQTNGKAESNTNDKANEQPKGKANEHKQECKEGIRIKEKNISYENLFFKVIEDHKIDLPEKYKELILEWLKYKSEKGQAYKETGLKALITKFLKGSGSDYTVARQMLDFSMSQNYNGLYKEKTNVSNQQINSRSYKRVNDYWNKED